MQHDPEFQMRSYFTLNINILFLYNKIYADYRILSFKIITSEGITGIKYYRATSHITDSLKIYEAI